MAKKTKAGGKIKPAAKPKKKQEKDSVDTTDTNSNGNKYNSSFSDHKKTDGKFQPTRIEKKRG